MELEMTGLTRNQAAKVIARYFHTEHEYVGGSYDAYRISDNSGRGWKIVSDASIYAEDKNGDDASSKYRVEMVTLNLKSRSSTGTYIAAAAVKNVASLFNVASTS